MNRTDAPYRFEAFEVSYFSAKVRPALRYKQLWFEERRADLGELRRRTGMVFIPVVITPEDETWQDSTEILEKLEARHPEPPLFPTTPVQRIAAQLVELYTDEVGLIPAMHYRWGSELGEASARARFSGMMGSAEAGNFSADLMVKARFAVGASPKAGPAIEAHTAALLAALSSHFQAHPYLLGDRMSVADCALMGPVDGHFFTDLVSRRLLLETAWPVVGWIERCKFPNPDEQGSWLADDAIAPTLKDVLTVMGADGVPVILACLRAVEAWADTRDPNEAKLPRAVGKVEAPFHGATIERGAFPYTLWMVQRTLDAYRALSPPDRKQVDEAIAGTGWEALLAYEPRHRMTKQDFQLAFA